MEVCGALALAHLAKKNSNKKIQVAYPTTNTNSRGIPTTYACFRKDIQNFEPLALIGLVDREQVVFFQYWIGFWRTNLADLERAPLNGEVK